VILPATPQHGIQRASLGARSAGAADGAHARWSAPAAGVLSVAAAAALAAAAAPAAHADAGPPASDPYQLPPPTGRVPKEVVLYQYEVCPYCCKVKAVLDYYKVGACFPPWLPRGPAGMELSAQGRPMRLGAGVVGAALRACSMEPAWRMPQHPVACCAARHSPPPACARLAPQVPYRVVEVNPLTKKELKSWSTYKKVGRRLGDRRGGRVHIPFCLRASVQRAGGVFGLRRHALPSHATRRFR